ncbi:hypothetical protein EON79_20935, partial [bacterium]
MGVPLDSWESRDRVDEAPVAEEEDLSRQPVLLGIPDSFAAAVSIPLPPVASKVSKRPHRWVKPGEAVEIHGRRIDVGLFFFGDGMRDLLGWGFEPSLVDPSLPVERAEPPETRSPAYNLSYRGLGENGRASLLDWMAAGRPAETMTDEQGLFFLSGIERRCIKQRRRGLFGDAEATREVHRLMEGAPAGSIAAVRMRAFLFFVALHNGTADSLVPETLDLTRLDRHRDMVALYVLSKKMANQESLSADESIAALLIKGDLSPRTPYHRCHREVMTVYRRLYAERYK